MSPASKFWLGVILLLLIIIQIKLPILFFIIFILYLIVSSVLYFIINAELKGLLLQQEYYEERQRKEEATWFKNHYSDRTKEIERYLFYLKFILIHWVVTAFNSFNNFLNNKFSKNG